MKQLWLLYIHLFGLLLLCSCSNPESPELPKQNRIESFFPLTVGNVWYYGSYSQGVPADTSKYDEKKEVTSKRNLGNREFYLLLDTYYNTDRSINTIDSCYYCLTNDSLLNIHINRPFADSSISVSLIFPPTLSSTFTIDGGYEGSVVQMNDSIVVFGFWKPGWIDSGWNETYKRNIGLIDTHSSWGFGSVLIKYDLKN
jgi:hypothetical protein